MFAEQVVCPAHARRAAKQPDGPSDANTAGFAEKFWLQAPNAARSASNRQMLIGERVPEMGIRDAILGTKPLRA
jgi:hypothetical protein